jgi:hypothetical protein
VLTKSYGADRRASKGAGKENRMSDLDIIIFAIAGVVIILFSLYVVISMTQDINNVIGKCNEIGTWAKNELERRNE